MRKYIYLFLFSLVILTSCGSSKQLSKSNVKIQTDSLVVNHDSTISKEVSTIVTDEKGTEQLITEVTTYDTKVTDANGTHPVLSKSVSTLSKAIISNKKETIKNSVKISNNDSIKVVKNVTKATETSKIKSETSIFKQISGLIWSIIAFVCLISLIFIIYKFRKQIKILLKL